MSNDLVYYKGLPKTEVGLATTLIVEGFGMVDKVDENSGIIEVGFVENPRLFRISQTLGEILNCGFILPHTKNINFPMLRVCVSHPCPQYRGSYHPEGILFTTSQKPDFCLPFDFLALAREEDITGKYESPVINVSREFIFNSIELMYNKFPESIDAITRLNIEREKLGLKIIKGNMNYNELCFCQVLAIEPVALVGESQEVRSLASERGLKIYTTLTDYLEEGRGVRK